MKKSTTNSDEIAQKRQFLCSKGYIEAYIPHAEEIDELAKLEGYNQKPARKSAASRQVNRLKASAKPRRSRKNKVEPSTWVALWLSILVVGFLIAQFFI